MSRRERAGDDGHPSRGSRRREGRCSLSWRVVLRKDCPGLGPPAPSPSRFSRGRAPRRTSGCAKGVVRHDPIAVIPLSPMISSKGCGLSIRPPHLRPARVRKNSHASTRLRNCHIVARAPTNESGICRFAWPATWLAHPNQRAFAILSELIRRQIHLETPVS